MTPSKKILKRALEMAAESIITGEGISCYDVCKVKMDYCAVRHDTERQLKVCVGPIIDSYIRKAQNESKVKGEKK